MERKKRFLYKNKKYHHSTHMRWIREKVPQNRVLGTEEYNANEELWLAQQCFSCQFYIPLKGEMGKDWGVCSHPSSPFDAHLMFEHDGCEHHSIVSDDELWSG